MRNSDLIATIDLSRSRTNFSRSDPELLNRSLGGRGLGAAMLLAQGPRIAPMAEESSIYLMVGPLTGTNFPLANRLCFVFRSPATGTIGWANTGGYAAAALRNAGFLGLELKGRASVPSMIAISRDSVEVLEAGDLWGRGAVETCEELVRIYGDVRVVAIGPAGEDLSPVATVINDKGGPAGFGMAWGRCWAASW